MTQNFLPDSEAGQGTGSGDPASSSRDREPVRITVSGSSQGITAIIQRLYSIGFAQIHEWSKLQHHPQTDELFCILTKYVRSE